MFGVIFLFYFLQNDAFVDILILIKSWKDVSCINHHPPKPIISFLSFSYLANRGSDF